MADTLANRLYNTSRELSNVEEETCQALLKAFGHDNWEEFPWPFADFTYDNYDSSFELRGVPDSDWVPTQEQLNAAFDLGFYQCWICYADGEERHASRKGIGSKVSGSRGAGDREDVHELLKKVRDLWKTLNQKSLNEGKG